MSDVGELLRRAMADKSAEVGRRYTLRDLDRESGVDYTLLSHVIAGRQRATPEALCAWSKALQPHLDMDAALLAAGHPPTDPAKAGAWRRLWRLTSEQWAELERWVGERVTEREAGEQGGEEQQQDEPPAQTQGAVTGGAVGSGGGAGGGVHGFPRG